MHICMVMAGDEEGGLEKHVVEMANGLVQLGHQVSLIAHEKYADRVKGVNFIALDLTRSRKNPVILWQLYQAIKKMDVDVLHAQANKAASMIAPLLNWLKIPAVATLHNLKRNTSTFNKFDRIIAVSQRVAAQFESQERVRVVLNGIQLPEKRKSKALPHFRIQVIAIGRLVEAKGFDLLIESWQGIDAHLWIVGDGPDKVLLMEKIQQLKLEHTIQLLGHRNDIEQLLKQADVLVISSRNEGGPYTLSEALLQYCPVISTDVGMVPEILPQHMICPPNDVNALHQLIEKHLSNFSQLVEDSRPAFELAEQQLTIEAMIQNTVQVYEELVNA
ncbi:glycosyltransferase [Acinetobacter thermotolerans]|uniref:glycosyltransferase n=1 Tax=Acinetobacter thermotolerans TaxID=3151487 RepID=UPI00325AC106